MNICLVSENYFALTLPLRALLRVFDRRGGASELFKLKDLFQKIPHYLYSYLPLVYLKQCVRRPL